MNIDVISVTRHAARAEELRQQTKEIKRKWAWHYQALLCLRQRLVAAQAVRLAEASEPLEPPNLTLRGVG